MSTLSFGDNENSSPSHLSGTFVNLVTIVHAESISGKDVYNNGNPVDCGVRLTIDIGREWQPKMMIHGNFKKEGDKIGWGSAFAVKDLLTKLKLKGQLNPDGSIPQDLLDAMVGRKFVRLSYIRGVDQTTGKKRYTDYRHVEVPKNEDDAAEVAKLGQVLTNKFVKDVTNGWVKNFQPDAGSEDTSFPTA